MFIGAFQKKRPLLILQKGSFKTVLTYIKFNTCQSKLYTNIGNIQACKVLLLLHRYIRLGTVLTP